MDELPQIPALPDAPEAERAPEPSRQRPVAPGPPAAPAPAPGTLGPAVPPAFNLALFALTFASALLAGLMLEESLPEGPRLLPALLRASSFAGALLVILLAHEMGHFLLARRHRVDASWPYFLPAPLFSFIGTFGAVIRLRALPRTRDALVDIAAAGPLCGFVVALPVLFIGLKLSRVIPEAPMEPWTLWDALVTWSRTGEMPSVRDAIGLGEPLLLQLLEHQRFGPLAASQSIELHPVALAGWVGLFVTALNLLPLGQLDGGHILYALSARVHRALGAPLSAVLVGLGVFTPFTFWIVWGVLTGTVLSHHPPLREETEPLGRGRVALAIAALVIFVVSFAPVPLALLSA